MTVEETAVAAAPGQEPTDELYAWLRSRIDEYVAVVEEDAAEANGHPGWSTEDMALWISEDLSLTEARARALCDASEHPAWNQRRDAEILTPLIEAALRTEAKPITVARARAVVSRICEDELGPGAVCPVWVEPGPTGLRLIVRFRS